MIKKSNNIKIEHIRKITRTEFAIVSFLRRRQNDISRYKKKGNLQKQIMKSKEIARGTAKTRARMT